MFEKGKLDQYGRWVIIRWLPWKFLVKRTARSYGVIDPFKLLARLRSFSQPSEVQEPIELLRAGIFFHARGLINTKAIQHNLDWIWPFWIEKQFNPRDSSFIPRAFSFSHVNLTHRNWTAVGHPDVFSCPIVDPRGLVTPFYDGWSLDFWIIPQDGQDLISSKIAKARQELHFQPNLEVSTVFAEAGQRLSQSLHLDIIEGRPEAVLSLQAKSLQGGWVAVSVRPYNPEGIQFVDRIDFQGQDNAFIVNKKERVILGEDPDRVALSSYSDGDVYNMLPGDQQERSVRCEVGLATAAALFALDPGKERELNIRVPLGIKKERWPSELQAPDDAWTSVMRGTSRLQLPDPWCQFLYDAAVRSLLLLSSGDVVPGPYTYKRFWFRDGCIMLGALLALGCTGRCRDLLSLFFTRQKRSGYFQSQKGEWDSNGQVLWVFERYQQLSGERLPNHWLQSLFQGAKWIEKKRRSGTRSRQYPGLLPPGFSAEHLGPNDYYYWDDFWGLAGLQSVARLAGRFGFPEKQKEFAEQAEDLQRVIERSISDIPDWKKKGGIPASPNRRLDAGAIGSLVADYPLQLRPANDPEIRATIEFLFENCFCLGGFFQDMIHSGVNPYLTLSITQTMLRNKDSRYRELIQSIADLASPTGQWPEAVHPITRGGCMGDGQHGWAAAEWVMMIRNLFVREEPGSLILGSGLYPEWLDSSEDLSFGPTLTPYGPVSLQILKKEGGCFLRVEGQPRDEQPRLVAEIPGFERLEGIETDREYRMRRV